MANINQTSPDGGTTLYDIEDTPVRSSIARTEDGTSPSATINTGEEFYHLNVLYKATQDIATTDTITPNSNCEVSPSVTSQIAQKADKSSLGTASAKNSTSVVTDSSDLVESGAVENIIGWGNKNLFSGFSSNYSNYHVIATVNADKTVTVTNDGSSASANAFIEQNVNYTFPYPVILSGCPTNGSDASYRLDANGSYADYGEGVTIPANTNITKIRIRIANGYTPTNLVFEPMIRKADVTDATYEPYHASVEDTLGDAEVVEGKNLLALPYNVSDTINGLTFTVNDDNSITVNGTATANVDYVVNDWQKNQNTFDNVKNQRVILSGCPSGGSANTYSIYGYRVGGATINARDTGNGDTFVFRNDNTVWNIAISIKSGIVINNLTFRPMIRKATETDPTYEPYYTPLKDVVPTKADNSVIGTVEGANASKAWSVGEHFINDGQFKEVTQAIASGGTINDSNTVNKPIADCLIKQATFSGTTSSGGGLSIYSGLDRNILGVKFNQAGIIGLPYLTSNLSAFNMIVVDTSLNKVIETSVSGTYYYI